MSLPGSRLLATIVGLWVIGLATSGATFAATPDSTWVALPSLRNQPRAALFALAVDPSNNQVVIAGDAQGSLARSTNGGTVWAHSESSTLTMRKLTPQFIGRYLAAAGEEVLSSVGAYQLEGLGIQLFEKIDGDYFSILGLPLLPLLDALRREGAIEG